MTQQMKDLIRERDQLKKLNEKLMQKIDELQTMIESEASANDYYFNYPQKQDKDLNEKGDTEAMKMKRIFEEQMTTANKKWEEKYAKMATSFTEEVERYHEQFTESQSEMIYWKNMFVDLDARFKEFTMKSERYIKDRDEKLQQLQ